VRAWEASSKADSLTRLLAVCPVCGLQRWICTGAYPVHISHGVYSTSPLIRLLMKPCKVPTNGVTLPPNSHPYLNHGSVTPSCDVGITVQQDFRLPSTQASTEPSGCLYHANVSHATIQEHLKTLMDLLRFSSVTIQITCHQSQAQERTAVCVGFSLYRIR
jgi:hypothetical protein